MTDQTTRSRDKRPMIYAGMFALAFAGLAWTPALKLQCWQVSRPTVAAEPEPSEECGKPGEEGHRVVSVLFEAPSSLDPEEQRERLERLATRFGGSTGQVVLLEGGGFEIPIAVPSESCPALLEALFQ